MALARLVVIEGPDLGCEFAIPLRGGGIGREAGNVVQLSDLSVSRSHCRLELRGGQIALVDDGSRNHTLVNGAPVTAHILRDGDEISVGKTRLAFLPADGGLAVMRQDQPGRVTMEVGSRALMAADTVGISGHLPQAGDSRAVRHLAALARLGDVLRQAGGVDGLGRAACEACLDALAADRVFLLRRDSAGRMTPSAAAVSPDDAEGSGLALPREMAAKVAAEGKALAMQTGRDDAPRSAIASRLYGPAGSGGPTSHVGESRPPRAGSDGGADDPPIGLLYADRRGEPWDRIDLMAMGCLAQIISGALAGAQVREVLTRENQVLSEQLGTREFVGSSPRAEVVLRFVGKVGPSDATVLLTGESGSGKEMVARAVHRASRRRRGPFIAVNCAALTESLIESELFGHEKGAFTGATERKPGRFELADKGTLFLDEVGELPLQCQTKFLRVLEERVFERVGGSRQIAVDVRVVAATNRDLGEMVRRGRFREDLYYRLSVIHSVVPPLRERAGDIPELAEHFLRRLRAQVSRRIAGFSPEAMRALVAHPWPGNVRELKNAVERAIVLGEGEVIRVEDLPPNIAGASAAAGRDGGRDLSPAPALSAAPIAPPAAGAAQPQDGPAQAARPLRELERDGIVAALAATGGNKAQAAALLEIDRSTLYKKIKDYDIKT